MALPDQVMGFVTDTLDLFPEESEKVVEAAISSSPSEHAQDIVNAAVKAGMDKESAIKAAVNAGAEQSLFVNSETDEDKEKPN